MKSEKIDGAPVSRSTEQHRRSYWKTILAAGFVETGAVVAAVVVTLLAARQHAIPPVDGWVPASLTLVALVAVMMFGVLVASGGSIALHRDALERAGRPYASRKPREARRSMIAWSARAFLGLMEHGSGKLHLRPGDRVVVRNLDEILATLDENGTLDGVPFMPEMIAFCGRPATVFRRIDKIHDWIHRAGLKRVRDVVQLDDARCSGEAHGGCESNCRLRWKEAWLRRGNVGARVRESETAWAAVRLYQLTRRETADGRVVYRCQGTDIAAGGQPLALRDPRHFVRDLATGNVRWRPLFSGLAVTCFNWIQRRRGGAVFPHLTVPESVKSPTEVLGLEPGERVRVKSKERIVRTLNNQSRNRGLYFDPEMLRYCGGEYAVRGVLHRVIAERTGELKTMTMPSIVLEGVRNTGEYIGFNPEDEHIFWREIWLERVAPAQRAHSRPRVLADSHRVSSKSESRPV